MTSKAGASIVTLVACLTAALAVATNGQAGLVEEARALERKLGEVRAQGKWNGTAESALVEEIENVARRYHRLAERGALAGGASVSAAVRRLLERAQENYGEELKRWQGRIIAEDGDLEAAQDSPQWQEREALAARIQYWLNWVHYLAAARFERSAKERRRWLEDSLEGFSSFAFQDRDRKLAAESLFGRGLVLRELGRYREAAAELRRASDSAPDSDTRLRARMALVDLLLDRKDYAGALGASSGLPSDAGSFGAQAEFLRSKAVLLALREGAVREAKTRERLRSEAAKLLERLSRRGSQWSEKARKLFVASVSDPRVWAGVEGGSFVKRVIAESLRAKGEYQSALALYRQLLSEKTPSGGLRAELLVASGICSYQLRRYREAFDSFEEALRLKEGARGDTRYLKFKAAEALYFSERSSENAHILETSIKEYLAGSPNHRQIFEAYYRLGELEAERGMFVEASESFSRVEGEKRFALKARFLAAQALVQEVDKLWKSGETGGETAELVESALAKLAEFRERAAALEAKGKAEADTASVVPLLAKSALMEIRLRKHKSPPDWAGVISVAQEAADLEGVEAKTRAELVGAGVEALARLKRTHEARDRLAGVLALCKDASRCARVLRELGVAFLEVAQEARARGESSVVLETNEMALSVYQALLTAAESKGGDPSRVAGFASIVSKLREEISRLRREAGKKERRCETASPFKPAFVFAARENRSPVTQRSAVRLPAGNGLYAPGCEAPPRVFRGSGAWRRLPVRSGRRRPR